MNRHISFVFLVLLTLVLARCDSAGIEPEKQRPEKTEPSYSRESVRSRQLLRPSLETEVMVEGRWCFARSSADSVAVFRRQGGSWTLSSMLGVEREHLFGERIIVDGDRAIITATYHDPAEDYWFVGGTAYIFEWNGAEWVERANLISEEDPEYEGGLLDVSLDGDVVLVEASFGKVLVFEWNGGAWHKQLLEEPLISRGLVAGEQLFFPQNHTVLILEKDGSSWKPTDRIVTRHRIDQLAWHDEYLLLTSSNGFDPSSVLVFKKADASWEEVAELEPGDGAPMRHFGRALDTDGEFAVVGAPGNGTNHCGAVYVYERVQDTWIEVDMLSAGDWPSACAGFGRVVSIDRGRLVVGGDAGVYSYTWPVAGG